MKNVLLTFALLLTFGLSFGQIKVVTSGYTGIGTSTPIAQLHVTSSIALEPTAANLIANLHGVDADTRLVLSNNTTNTNSSSYLAMNGAMHNGNFVFGASFHSFRTNKTSGNFGSESMRLLANGNLGVGTSSPTEKLHVAGNIFATGTITPSDKRLKNNVRNYTEGLETVLKMRPVIYKYNGEAGIKTDMEHVSVIAQELQEIAPSLVSDFEYIEHEGSTNKIIKKETYLKIYDGAIKWMLVNSIQEQQVQIDAKDAQIDVLTERLIALETAVMNIASGSTTQSVEIRDSRLGQNAPNPFTQATVINYAVPTKAQTAVMQVFDMNGQLLKSVNVANGNGELTINAGELAAGTYSYNLVVDGKVVDTKKMVLTK